MEKLYVSELKDLYSAENQIIKTLPKLAKAAVSPELKAAFENHLVETRGQVERLEKIFQMMGGSPKGKSCAGMKGVLEEGAEILQETEQGDVRDAALISAAQRVEHYEMAGYGSVRSYAQLLGQPEAARLLQETLEEEEAADKKLTELSKKLNANARAQQKQHATA